MFRIPLSGDDTVILLTPRWGDLPPVAQVLLLVAVTLVPLALVVWLYRYEMRLVAAGTARLLLGLRFVALLLLLFLVLLEPKIVRTTKHELAGRVIVAVDVSDSMDTTDPQREPVDKLRLARALKLAGDLASGTRLDDWIAQYEAKKAVQFVADNEFVNDAAGRNRAEQERRKAHDQIVERVDALSRSQTARHLLSRDGVRLLGRIADKHKVELLGFGSDVFEVPADQADELFKKPTPGKAPAKPDEPKDRPATEAVKRPRSNTTDLATLLSRVAERSNPREGKVLGVVVVTDGIHNAPESPVKKAEDIKKQAVPLYPVAMGGQKTPPDVIVLGVTAPPAAFKDVEAPVKVRFRVVGLKAQELSIKVHRPGEEDKPLDQRTIPHDGKDQEYTESFQVKLDKEGRQTLIAAIKPLGENVKETNLANNQQSTIVSVSDEQSKVLLVDGEARWEFHYIWQALLRDRSMKVESVVYVQPRLGKVPEDQLLKVKNPALTLPPAPSPDQDPLFNYDCIILGDVLPEQLPRADRVRLERYVADRGGTLVVLAGKRAMPLGFLPPGEAGKPPAGESDDPLVKMLPIEQPKPAGSEAGFPVTLTEEGKATDFLKLEAEVSTRENEERWADLPKHYWGVTGKAKPGATVLAYLAGDERDLKPEEKRKREQDNALFARHNYGFGRVFFVGLDSSWRWRYRIGDLYHHRFWSQTIRWAASDKPLVTGNKFVRFGTPQAIFRDKESVQIVVRFDEELGPIPQNLLARARVLRKDGDGKEEGVALVELKRREAQPRVFEGQVRDLADGQYQIELAIPEFADKLLGPPGPDGKAEPLRASFRVSPGESGELVQLGTNWTLLKELAEKNGTGKVYTAENAESLIDLLSAKAVTHQETHDRTLWDWWVVLLVILLFLTVEWVIRKLAGLP